MDNTKWLRYVEAKQPHIVGEFENELGERYVIYRNANGDKPYITGDEMDWEIGFNLLWNVSEFMFNEYERAQIARILWPTVSEMWQAAGLAQQTTPDEG